MAAFINSSPNPILISAWRRSVTARITWTTGSAARGRVYLTVDGMQSVFDGAPNAKREGDKSIPVELGKTYDFQLRQENRQETVLATLRIKGEEKLGTTTGLAKVVSNVVSRSQHIYDVRVTPGIDSVRFRFRTRQAAPCFIGIVNDKAPKTVVAGALVAGALTHDVLLARGIGFTPNYLEQNANHTYTITAPSLPGSLVPGDKVATGQFRTGTRLAQFFFNRVLVHADGDPGFFLGDGDFEFYFGAGDVETGENLGNEESYGRESIGTGEFRDVNKVVTVPSAPPNVWAQVYAYEDDSVFREFRPNPVTQFAPSGSTCERGLDGPEASVTRHFDFSELTEGTEESLFEMTNVNCSIHFTTSCRVRVEAQAGALLQPFIKKSGLAPRWPLPRVAILLGDEKVIVGAQPGSAHVVRRAAGGAAFVRTVSRQSDSRSELWTPIGDPVAGPVTVVASSADRVSLFAVNADGAMVSKTISRDVPASDEWEIHGGTFIGPIAAAIGPDDRIEIFGLTGDGEVFHRTLNADGERQLEGDWRLFGDGVAGSLTAFSTGSGEVSVVALSQAGEILRKIRRRDGWDPAGRAWQVLGGVPEGALTLCAELVEDDILVLAVLAANEGIHLRPWRSYPDMPLREGWKCVGTINSLLDSRLSLLELPLDSDETLRIESSLKVGQRTIVTQHKSDSVAGVSNPSADSGA